LHSLTLQCALCSDIHHVLEGAGVFQVPPTSFSALRK
jgi:hypothetical protein